MWKLVSGVAIAIIIASAIFLLGAKWANDANTTYLNSQHVFCKECCWQTEHMFTCAKTKEELWRRVP